METKVKAAYEAAARKHRDYHEFRKAFIADYMKDHPAPPRGERGSEANVTRREWFHDLEHRVACAWIRWKSD